VANTMNLQHNGAVGFIDWLDVMLTLARVSLTRLLAVQLKRWAAAASCLMVMAKLAEVPSARR
jgi:hypothetical protein